MNSSTPFFITSPTNIRYLTGFVGSDPGNRDAYVLLTEDTVYLYTNSLYIEQAKALAKDYRQPSSTNDIPHPTLQVVQISRDYTVFQVLREMTEDLHYDTLTFEERDLRYYEYQSLRNIVPQVRLEPEAGQIEAARMIKNDDEIRAIRASCTLADTCFSFIRKKIRPGVTEREVAWEIESYIKLAGGQLAFEPIVAFGPHTSQPHYMPGSNGGTGVLGENDIVQLDFGARVDGYCSDISRVLFTGTPKDVWRKAYASVRSAKEKAFDAIRNGIRSGAKLDALARSAIETDGFTPYSHSLGHSLGLDIHEDPRLTVKRDRELLPGIVFTIEPAIYEEGQFGIRLEDTVYLADTGPEQLTESDIEPWTKS